MSRVAAAGRVGVVVAVVSVIFGVFAATRVSLEAEQEVTSVQRADHRLDQLRAVA